MSWPNQLRTLLLNTPGSLNPPPGYPGEEYVDPAYVPPVLTPALKLVWGALFGSSPDRAFLNWRLQELLTCVHGAGFGAYATALDPRVTYWPFTNSLMNALLLPQAASVTALTASAQQLYLLGSLAQSPGSRIYYQWKVTVLDASNVRVDQYSDASGLLVSTTLAYTTASNLSSVLPLGGSGLSFRFDAGVGAAWQVQALSRPSPPLPGLALAVQQTAGDVIDASLLPAGAPEPYATFGALWRQHDQLPYQLAGLALGLGYRINDLLG